MLQHASVVGQTFWEGSLARSPPRRGSTSATTLASLQEKDLVVPTAGQPARRRARVRLQARADPRRRLLDAAEVGARAQPRRGRRVHRGPRRPTAPRASWRWSPTTTAAPRRSAPTPGSSRPSSSRSAARALRGARGGRRRAPRRCTPTRRRSATTRRRSRCAEASTPAAAARIGEKLGDVALRLGRVDQAVEVWERCLEYHRREEDLARVGDLHRKIGAALWHKGEREGSIEHYQQGIDLLKDGPPCLELVRLYEEAASLYMHTGDNMLAIYASEKALRLAERLGEAAAASRAHGIFGRVFGRIGDSERARENLERSVELARESDPAEAVRALLTLGYHLEVSEAEYAERRGRLRARRSGSPSRSATCPRRSSCTPRSAQLAVYRGDWEPVAAETDASADARRARGPDRQALLPAT